MTIEHRSKEKPRRLSWIWLILASLVLIAFGFASGFMAMMSFMLFDAPGSDRSPLTIALFYHTQAGPLLCGFALIVGWVRAFSGARLAGLQWMLIVPLIWAVGIVGWLRLIERICDGQLSCTW